MKIDLINSLIELFGDSNGKDQKPLLTLSTIHKAKGKEWHKVHLLGRSAYIPSKYATQDWELEQESNLAYVAVTRAIETFIDIEVID